MNEKAVFEVVKGLLGIVRNHQTQIEALHRLIGGSIEMQSKIVAAITGSDEESPARIIDSAAVQRTRAEIEMLERMYRQIDKAEA